MNYSGTLWKFQRVFRRKLFALTSCPTLWRAIYNSTKKLGLSCRSSADWKESRNRNGDVDARITHAGPVFDLCLIYVTKFLGTGRRVCHAKEGNGENELRALKERVNGI